MECLRDLQWWLHLPRLSLGVSLHQVSPVLHFWSDASDVGWGAHLDCQVASGLWDTRQAALSFKNTKNLFIHIALIPEGDNPRVNPNILKCLLHSPVAKGYRLVVIASRAMVCKTPTYYLILNSLAFARGCVILRSHILFPLLLILLISHRI